MSALIENVDAVLFDFDGTLADSYAAIAASVNHVRGMRGLATLDLAEVKRFVGRGPNYLLENTVPGGKLEEDLARYRDHHPSVMRALTKLLPGAKDLIEALHRRRKKIGLCSNKPRNFSQEILQHLGLASFFTVVLGPEDVENLKPAPDMLLLAVERLKVAKGRALYVGDMVVDVQTAQSAGVCVWAVATGSEERSALEAARPDRILKDLLEMLAELPAM